MASTSSGVDTTPASSTEPSRTATPASAAVAEKAPDDSSKLKTFLGILRRCVRDDPICTASFFARRPSHTQDNEEKGGIR